MTIFDYWGKTRLGEENGGDDYHLLIWHSLDVAAVGHWMMINNIYHLDDHLSTLGFSSPDAKIDFLSWLLCCHDVGKFSHSFQQQYRHEDFGTQNDNVVNYSRLHHSTLGYWLCKQIMSGSSGLHPKSELSGTKLDEVLNRWMSFSTGHHGSPPEVINEASHFRNNDINAASEFLQAVILLFPHAEIPLHWAKSAFRENIKSLSWLLSAITVLADWIGSNTQYFPRLSRPMALDDYWKLALEKARVAVSMLPLPAVPSVFKNISTLFPFITYPTPLQEKVLNMDISAPGPQLFILEDVTGAGKTEAALILAHRLMAADKARGLFIGLPTMATANAMYERMFSTVRQFYRADSKPSLVLAHSARHLSSLFSQSVWLEGEGENHSTKACAAWFAQSPKRALLADVGVGTIDQAMMAVIPFRHHNLRLLGMSDKLLIADEIHACDTYMSTILESLIETQARYGNSTILLSATLSQVQRERLVAAFTRGLGDPLRAPGLGMNDYPWITHVAGGEIISSYVDTRKDFARRVAVEWLHTESDGIAAVLQAIEQGDCIAWIRNSVDDAARTYRALVASGKVDAENILLFHSRFAFCDRQTIESKTLRWFGKQESGQRAGKIIIATQVIEQSLDLDFDCMITDLAPVDLLIQRAGRLQRHIRTRQGEIKRGGKDERHPPVLQILAPEWRDEPPADWLSSSMRNSAYIYPDHSKLWLTQRVLRQQQDIRMPEAARLLIEAVYAEDIEIPSGFEHSHTEQTGKYYCDRAIADQQLVNFAPGYMPAVNHVLSEKLATRLAEESITLWLAKPEAGEVLPWASGDNAWEMSSLHVRKSWWRKHENDFALLEGAALNTWCKKQRQHEGKVILLSKNGNGGYSAEEGLMGKGELNGK